jgi:hypothetical protein
MSTCLLFSQLHLNFCVSGLRQEIGGGGGVWNSRQKSSHGILL